MSFLRRAATGLMAAVAAVPLLLAVAQPAQAADTFSCTGAASVFAAETGGILWRYPFNSPGTASAAHGTRAQVGTGWNTYGRVLGGPDGRIYGINSTGLNRYRWNGSAFETVNGSQHSVISTSFTQYATAAFRNKITVDEIGDFYLVDGAGKLRWYRYDEASNTWPIFARVLDTGWDKYDLIVAGGPGVLYARVPAGQLYRYRYEPTSQRWLDRNVLVGSSAWNGMTKGLFSAGGDTLFGIQADGDFFHYRYREDTNTWPLNAKNVGTSWQQFSNVLTLTNTCRLSDRHVPARPATPVASYGTGAALQGPTAGTALGPVEYLHADNIGRLRHGYQVNPDDFGSVQWTTLPTDQAFTGKPALVPNAQGVLQALAHNANSDVWSFTKAAPPSTSTTFPAGVGLGGAMRSAPALVKLSDGTQAAFGIDAAGALWYRSQDGSAGDLLPWRSLGGTGLTGDPFVLATADRSALLITADAAGTLRTATYRDGTLSAWTSLGESGFVGTPSLVTMPGPSLRIFARAADGTIRTQRQDASGAFPGVWSAVGSLPVASPPAAILDPVLGRLAVVAKGTDGEIYRTFETGQGTSEWGDWARVKPDGSDPAASDPIVVPLTNASGQSWVIVFRNLNDTTRVYERQIPGASALRTTGPRPAVQFRAHSLPNPK